MLIDDMPIAIGYPSIAGYSRGCTRCRPGGHVRHGRGVGGRRTCDRAVTHAGRFALPRRTRTRRWRHDGSDADPRTFMGQFVTAKTGGREAGSLAWIARLTRDC